MVPRKDTRTTSRNRSAGIPARLLGTWRLLLASLARRTGGVVRSGAPAIRTLGVDAATDMAQTVRTGAPRQMRPGLALVIGLAATIIGAVGMRLIDPARSAGYGIATAFVGVLWVLARLAVMRLANRPGSTIADDAVPIAWAAGALPQLIALTPALRTVAWALGIALTIRTLLATGGSRRDAIRLAAWGYGIEIAGFFMVALGRSIDVALRVFLGG